MAHEERMWTDEYPEKNGTSDLRVVLRFDRSVVA